MSGTPSRAAGVADFIYHTAAFTPDELKITAVDGSEGISELFALRVELCSDNTDIDPATQIGQMAAVEIRGAEGTRWIHGFVREFQRAGQGRHLAYYAAELVPVHWLLTQRYRSRIFQSHNCSDMSVPGIIKKVLLDAGIQDDQFRMAISGKHEPREYVVQYRESEFDFISRLMEEAGILYFFEHGEQGHKMVIADSGAAHVATPGTSSLPYRDPSSLVPEEDKECVYRIRDRHLVQTGAVGLSDYIFTQPRPVLRGTMTGKSFTSLFYEDYPGNFEDKGVGDALAAVRLEERQAQVRVLEMSGTCRVWLPGFKFSLTEHPTEALNAEYLTTRIVHRARQPQSGEEDAGGQGATYDAELLAIPAGVPFRPPRNTPRPFVQGSQTALVVGPEGEEIYTDKYGRVKVQFHWDPDGKCDENSSCWIRVSQGMAGGQYGMMFLPRVGQEVVVEFLEGNPDRPMITGRVFNKDQMPPYALPDHKTRSTIKTHSSKQGGGSNEIRFEDLKDSEQILIHAQKDFHLRVTNDRIESIEHDQSLEVKNDFIASIGRDLSLTIAGKESYKTTGTRSLTVSGDVVDDFKANHKHEVTGTLECKAASIKLEATSGIELKCGGSSVVLTPSAVFIKGGPLVNINSGSGPPVSPVTAKATSPAEPKQADDVTPGQDVRYSQTGMEFAAVEVKSQAAKAGETEEQEKKSWVAIRLVDEEGQPVPSEPYKIVTPEGRVVEGTTDSNGMARVSGIDPGNCQITFPRLDRTAWRRKS